MPSSLPPDIEQVWGLSERSREFAARLVADPRWGADRFRRSQLHLMAVHEQRRARIQAAARPGDLRAIARGNGSN